MTDEQFFDVLKSDGVSGVFEHYPTVGAALADARKEIARLNAIIDAVRIQAQCWAQEARTQTDTIHRIYEIVTSKTGEPFGEHEEPKPQQPELVEGFWYIDTIANANRLFKYDGFFDDIRSPLYIRPATLDDLAIDMGGVKVWMVERDNCNHINLYQYDGQYRLIASFYHTYLEIPIARAIADAMHVPIITEAQWELLTKEAGK